MCSPDCASKTPRGIQPEPNRLTLAELGLWFVCWFDVPDGPRLYCWVVIRGRPRRRSKLASTWLPLGAGLATALIIVLAMPVSSAAPVAERGTTSRAATRTLTCGENMGAGAETDPAGALTIGPVELLGVTTSQSLTLARLAGGVLWFKTYIVVANPKDTRVDMSVRSLSGGRVGLDWGTQHLGYAKHPHYTPLSSLKATTLSMPHCNGTTSAGFPGGFVMTKPLCARIVVRAGRVSGSDRLSFGGAPCPVDQT